MRDELADAPHARTNAYRLFDNRQGFKIQLANLVENRRRQGLTGDVFHDVDQAADVARGIEYAG